MSLAIHHHGRITVAIAPDGLVNASLLAKRFGRNPVEYLTLDDTYLAIEQIFKNNGRQVSPQWQNIQVRKHRRPEYLHLLAQAKIIRQDAGTPGGHVAAAPNVAGNGVYNYASGLWVHPALAVGLARWLECRGQTWKPSPLADFVEKVAGQKPRQGGDA